MKVFNGDKGIEIEGVLSGSYALGSQNAENNYWEIHGRLHSWKYKNGELNQTPLIIYQRYKTRHEMEQVTNILSPLKPVKLTVTNIEEDVESETTTCVLWEYLGTSKSEELQKLSERLKKPFYIEDEILGLCTLNRQNNCFDTEITWNNLDIRMTIEAQDECFEPNSLKMARELVTNAAKWQNKWIEFALANIWNPEDDWYDEDISWTPQLFLSEPLLFSINCMEDDWFIMNFDSRRLYCGHYLVVDGDLGKGLFVDWMIWG